MKALKIFSFFSISKIAGLIKTQQIRQNMINKTNDLMQVHKCRFSTMDKHRSQGQGQANNQNTHNTNTSRQSKYQQIRRLLAEYQIQLKQQNSKKNAIMLKKLNQFNKFITISQHHKFQQLIRQIIQKFVKDVQQQASIISRNNKILSIIDFLKIVQILCYHNFIPQLKKERQNITAYLHSQILIQSMLKVYQNKSGLLVGNQNKYNQLKKQALIAQFITKYSEKQAQLHKLQKLMQQKNKQQNLHEYPLSDLIHHTLEMTKLSAKLASTRSTPTFTPVSANSNANQQFMAQIFDIFYEKILAISPKYLFKLTKILIEYRKGYLICRYRTFISAIHNHIEGLKLLQTRDISDAVYLLETLQNIAYMEKLKQKVSEQALSQIRQTASKIYQFITTTHLKYSKQHKKSPQQQKNQLNQLLQDDEKEEPEMEEQKEQNTEESKKDMNEIIENQKLLKKLQSYRKLSCWEINIVLNSMVQLAVIDSKLFGILQEIFIQYLPSLQHYDIISYSKIRNVLLKGILSSISHQANLSAEMQKQKTRLIKQEQKKFLIKTLQKLMQNKYLGLSQKLQLIQNMQQIQIKCRKAKKIVMEMVEEEEKKGAKTNANTTNTTSTSVNADVIAYGKVVAQGF